MKTGRKTWSSFLGQGRQNEEYRIRGRLQANECGDRESEVLCTALQIWREKIGSKGDSNFILESYSPSESIDIFAEALSSNTVDYNEECISLPFKEEILKWARETHKILSTAKVPPVYKLGDTSQCLPTYYWVDGDGTLAVESAQADGLEAEPRVGVPGEHGGILSDHHVFRMLKHWLDADSDPFYNPRNDYVILLTTFEMDRYHEKGMEATSLKEEWEIITAEGDDEDSQFEAIKPTFTPFQFPKLKGMQSICRGTRHPPRQSRKRR